MPVTIAALYIVCFQSKGNFSWGGERGRISPVTNTPTNVNQTHSGDGINTLNKTFSLQTLCEVLSLTSPLPQLILDLICR